MCNTIKSYVKLASAGNVNKSLLYKYYRRTNPVQLHKYTGSQECPHMVRATVCHKQNESLDLDQNIFLSVPFHNGNLAVL